MIDTIKPILDGELRAIREGGLYKDERVIDGPQGAHIRVGDRDVLNFCANNYLGLSSHPEIIRAAHDALDRWGYGLSSVRFICGTQGLHKDLERAIAAFFGTEDAILYTSCFDANGGLFETLLGEEDAVISDALNHASIIDGIRLCKAERHRYANGDMKELEEWLRKTQSRRLRLIATDGVFSMDGTIANLPAICELADRYKALVMVDDSHATGFVGKTGRGTAEHHGVAGRIDVMTSTLGKALGGAAGGFTTGRREIVEMLRQRSRPYLFSNTLPPAICGAALKAFELLSRSSDLRDRLAENTRHFRSEMTRRGFDLKPGTHPICPIMLHEAKLAQEFARAKLAVDMARALLDEGVYVIGFSFPVVPKGQARIRVQISAAHSKADLDRALGAFEKVGRKLGVLKGPAA
jgi:glycine C-acetyltransferase